MGRELTRRHSSLFENKLINPFLFAHDIYKYGKFREIVSFLVWELLHRFGLFRKEKYLQFTDGDVLSLRNETLHDPDFSKRINHVLKPRALTVTRSEHNWKLLFITGNKEIFGCLYPDDKNLYKSVDNGNHIVLVTRFPERIKSIFISAQNTIFVCARGAVYKSSDNGGSFTKALELASAESWFRYNNGMTETPDRTLIIGEYGNVWEKRGWRKLAYLYFSSDNGETWDRSDFLIHQGINKHVHLVKYSKLLNKIFVADGDNKKKLWVSDPVNSGDVKDLKMTPVNRFHIQMGGYTSIAETEDKLFFGTDYQGGTNFIVETTDGEHFAERIVPDPYRRSPINNMIQRRSKKANEIWAHLPFSTAHTKCLLMYTVNGGRSWSKIIEYNGTTHKVSLLSSSNETTDELYFSIEDSRNGDRVVYKIADQE